MVDHDPTTTRTGPDEVERALLEYATESILLMSETGDILARTGHPSGPLGFDPASPEAAAHPAEHVHPDDLLAVLEMVHRVRSSPGSTESIRVRARHRDGSWRIIEGTVTHAGADPRLAGAVLRLRDVTGSESHADMTPSPTRDAFRSLAEVVPSGILSADIYGWVVYCNEAAQRMLDLPAEALRGRGWERVVHPEDLPDVVAAAGGVLGSSPSEQVTFRVEARSGHRWLHARFVPLVGESHRSAAGSPPTGWIATIDDITDRRRAESQLAHQATHDPLTGLPNRALLDDRLEQACARHRRDAAALAVLFVDLDGFKAVNDEFGHRLGDRLLQEVARRLQIVLRAGDTVARVGGDEFVAVCEGVAAEEAALVASRIEDAIEVPFLIDGHHCSVGASVGIACQSAGVAVPEEILMAADQDMYRTKRARLGEPAA